MTIDRTEIQAVRAFAAQRAGASLEFVNLTTVGAVARYVQKADEVGRFVPAGSRVLDWGCGAGLMAYLLARRGLRAEAVDIALPEWVIAREAGVEPIVAGGRGEALPFPDESFRAVVGCGVFEHVADQAERLAELHRVLESGGFLFVYNYPNALSWIEWVFERLHQPERIADAEGNVHGHAERKLRLHDLALVIAAAGFKVRETRIEDLLPQTLRTLPEPMRRWLLEPHRLWSAVDRALLQVPGLRRLGTNLTVIAQRL